MKKITLWGASVITGIMFLAAPIAAGAVSIDDLQNQVASLLKQIAQLQTSTQVISGSVSSGSASSPVQFTICSTLNRNLGVGSRGDDVMGLQQFLQTQGYLSVSPTGFFGPMTSQAVSKWQSSEGISAVGAFGPMSRGRLMKWCGGNVGNTSTGNGVLQATPLSGDSPLTVNFTTSVGINDSIPSVDFGDGQTGAMTKGSCIGITAIVGGQGGIRCSASVTHTYTSNGSFTATLVNGPQKGDVGISVGGTSQGSLQADPQSGAAPLSTNFTYHPASENGTYHIEYGDGSSEQMTTQQIYCIKAPCISPAVSSHTYAAAGTYEVVVSPYIACMYSNPRCMIAVMPLAKTTVTVTGTGNYQTFTATPQSGSAPLTVKFSTWIGGLRPSTISYVIDYGDGASENATECNAPADACISAGVNTHTYTANGTYTATLNEVTNTCPAGAQCFVGPIKKVIAQQQITVGSSSCKPITYMPILCSNGQAAQPQHDANGCITGYQCVQNSSAPVISSFSGPTTLAVGATGTWAIQASDPANGTLSYSINWGDQNAYAPMSAGASANAAFVQSTTFTHSYSSAGTYTVSISVRNASGQTAQTSTTVQVGSAVACTMEYAPVCGRPTGCANTCAPGQVCTAICQLYPSQTYGNTCMMNAAGATQVHAGACTSSNDLY